MMSRLRCLFLIAVGLTCLVTAFPATPVSADPGTSLQGLYTATDKVFRYNIVTQQWEYTLVRYYYLFFPDGRVYYGLPLGGLDRFDFGQAQREHPERCGTYAIGGGEIGFRFPGSGGQYALSFDAAPDGTLRLGKLSYTRVDAALEGLTLHGNYGLTSYTPTGPGNNGGVSGDRSISFTSDGRFYEQSFVGVVVGSPDATNGGAGSEWRGGWGTYRITGNTLELTYVGGQTRSFTLFLYPENAAQSPPQMIVVDGAHLLRRGDPYFPRPKLIARAGEPTDIQIQEGDAETAQQITARFAGATHTYLDNNVLAITLAGSEAPLVYCPYVYDAEQVQVNFGGQNGSLRVTGRLLIGNDGARTTEVRVQISGDAPVDVVFTQSMDRLDQ